MRIKKRIIVIFYMVYMTQLLYNHIKIIKTSFLTCYLDYDRFLPSFETWLGSGLESGRVEEKIGEGKTW